MAIHMPMGRQCTMANLNFNSRLHKMVSSTLLRMVNLASSRTRSLVLLSNIRRLDLSLLPINSIRTRHSRQRRSSHLISPTARLRLLYQQGLHPRPSARAQEHLTRNPASIILSTRLWRIAVTIFALTHTCNQLPCTRSKKMCSRNVLNGSQSFSAMVHLNSTSPMNKSGGYLRI
jgi:hypothetical protein